MKVLIVAHLWNDGQKDLGFASIPHTYIGSFEESGLGTCYQFYLDEHQHNFGTLGEERLPSICQELKPDFVIFNWLFSKPQLNPRAETFRIIRQDLGIPIVLTLHDAIRNYEVQMGEVLHPYVDLIMSLDGTDAFRVHARSDDKYIASFMPLDCRRFKKTGQPRDLDVSFLGRVYNERGLFINHLKQNGINVSLGGWDSEATKVPLDQYAEVLLRSKMTLDTSRTSYGDTLKWRSMEATLTGAVLLEYGDGTVSKFFEPMKEYMPFVNEHDLLEKVRYLLANDGERQKIGEAGYRRAWAEYSGEKWWHRLVGELQRRGVLKP